MSRPVVTPERGLRENLTPEGGYLLAVSGGIDSVALLHAALELRREFKLRLQVAHLDHGLRSESGRDAEFVAELAKQSECRFHLRTLNGAPKGENIEAWGRRERYRYFSEILYDQELDAVLTAHNADDTAETFLIRLIANKELKSIEKYDPIRRSLRPFLHVTRETISAYAKEHKLSFREDHTNLDQEFVRNKIRHTLIPFLEENFDRRIKEVISLRASCVAEDIQTLEELALKALSPLERFEFGSKSWLATLRELFRANDAAIQWRMAEQLLLLKLGFNVGREHSRLFVEFIMGNSEGIELPTGLTLRRRDGGILVA